MIFTLENLKKGTTAVVSFTQLRMIRDSVYFHINWEKWISLFLMMKQRSNDPMGSYYMAEKWINLGITISSELL